MGKREKAEKSKFSLLRVVLIAFIFPLMILGAYFALQKYGISKTLSLVGIAAIVIISIIAFIIGLFLKRKGKLKKFAVVLVSAFLVVILSVNILLLNSSYFIPHKTTTIHGRYYPFSLETSHYIQNLLEDKTVYMDKSNTYFEQEEKSLTAIDHSNIASLLSFTKEFKTLEEDFGILSREETKYLFGKEGDHIRIINKFNSFENAYFHKELVKGELNEVVFLTDRSNWLFFMPFSVFEEIKDLR